MVYTPLSPQTPTSPYFGYNPSSIVYPKRSLDTISYLLMGLTLVTLIFAITISVFAGTTYSQETLNKYPIIAFYQTPGGKVVVASAWVLYVGFILGLLIYHYL